MKKKKKFLSYEEERMGDLPSELSGDFKLAFRFSLPDHIPSSFNFKDKKKRSKPDAKIKYFVKAKLICEDEDLEIKHKAVMAVRERIGDVQANTTISETSEIKTWCCCSQGTSSLKAQFNKNVFTPMEDAEGELEIDNSECKVGVSKVEFALLQVVKQRIGHHHESTEREILRQVIQGPAAEEGNWKETMKLELDKIKYEVPDTKKKKGKTKKISKEDKFAMASLQPACHTKKFSNDYYLTVTTEYDGCVCCVDLPDAKMSMTIVPLVNPECLGL